MSNKPSNCLRPVDFRVVDLFAGPGGLDMAAEVLGIPSVGIELDSNACATRYAAGLETVPKDVREVEPRNFPDANVLAGGPPCQTFTVAGKGAGRKALDDVLKFIRSIAERKSTEEIDDGLSRLEDERTGLVVQPLRWAVQALDDEELEPYEAIVLEQVPAVHPVWSAYKSVLEQEGYDVAHGVLRTEEYGVPQTRRRAVLIARRGGKGIQLPMPTHQAYRKGASHTQNGIDIDRWVAMDQVLRGRGHPFRTVSNYGTGGDPKARGRRRSCEPSATVTGKISRTRVVSDDATEEDLPRLTKQEMGILQSFPEQYPWSGGDRSQQIGNAVPPRLGVHILAAALDLEIPEGTWDRLRDWTPPGARDSAPAQQG